MATLFDEALDNLSLTLQSLLPPSLEPLLKPTLNLVPLAITPVGLNRFVGFQAEPPGEIYGCRVDAQALVTVKASSLDTLNDTVTQTIRAFVGADPILLRQKGIFKLTLDALAPLAAAPAREFTLGIRYEYVKKPEESGGIIREIPLNLTVSS